MNLPVNQVVQGNCLDVMSSFPVDSVDFVMFCPPYYGLRDYGKATETVFGGSPDCEHEWIEAKASLVHENRNFSKGTQEEVHGEKPTTYIKKYDDKEAGFCVKCDAWRGQLGLEPTWQMYVEHLATVFGELKRVLKKSGSVYIVMGDTYAGSNCGAQHGWSDNKRAKVAGSMTMPSPQANTIDYQAKCLMGIPWRLAFALIEELGLILRNDVIWHKPNSMPSSVKDRLSQTYEHIFHFVKSRKYYYDLDAIREKHKEGVVRWGGNIMKVPPKQKNQQGLAGNLLSEERLWRNPKGKNPGDVLKFKGDESKSTGRLARSRELYRALGLHEEHPLGKNPGDIIKISSHHGSSLTKGRATYYERQKIESNPLGPNPSDFWSITTKPFKGQHFAVYPEAICVKPILSSCPPNGIVLDPMCGSGTTLVVAKKLGRKYVGIDINVEYVEMAKKRLSAIPVRLMA